MMTTKSSQNSSESPSRSEMKRQARQVEAIVRELIQLSIAEINRLPCDKNLQEEIALVATLKGSSWKRQIKHISKELRQFSTEPFLAFLEKKKGSKLKKDMAFHDIERMRDAIIEEAIDQYNAGTSTSEWVFTTVQNASEKFPRAGLDVESLSQTAMSFARSRKPVYKREIFRTLQTAQEKEQYLEKKES